MLFPRKTKAPKAGDATKDEIEAAKQIGDGEPGVGKTKFSTRKGFPITNKTVVEEGKVADFEPTENAYRTLREARSEARLLGKREKRAKAKEDEAAAAKK